MSQHTITGQQWRDLVVPELGEWDATLRVCVVIPARDCQPDLDRTLAALSRQTYPEELLEVVVVDDASPVPLTVPALAPPRTRVLRVEEAQEHGSGRARDRGARDSDADVILFLDADMIVDRWHVEAHARWHHVCSYAVVIGRKWFVEVDGITAEDVASAVPADGLEALLEGRPRQRHGWQENFIKKRRSLTRDLDDTFISVVGADVSIGRRLYERCGGFASYGVRGIVDTEFGYRAFTSGGLIVPDWQARAYHQGARSFTKQGDAFKRERLGLVANQIPIPMFRTINTGRRWTVPQVHAVVATDGAVLEDVLLTTDTLLGSTFTDLHVEVSGPAPQWLRDYYAHEQRVTLQEEASVTAFPAPVTLHVSPGVQVGPTAVASALERLASVPALRAEVAPGLHFVMRTTRSLGRAEMTGDSPPEPELVDADELGMERAVHHLTSQGMIALGPPPPPPTPKPAGTVTKGSGKKHPSKKKQLSIPARARRKARHLAGRARRRLRRVLGG